MKKQVKEETKENSEAVDKCGNTVLFESKYIRVQYFGGMLRSTFEFMLLSYDVISEECYKIYILDNNIYLYLKIRKISV